MIKKFLLSALLSAATLCGMAATETEDFTFSYASQPCTLNAYGYNALAQQYGAAMGFFNPSYAGMRIVKIDAYLNLDESNYENISNTKVFITGSAFNEEQQVIVPTVEPNIMVADVAPQLSSWQSKTGAIITDETVSVLSYELETPYVITNEPVFIGYYLTVDRVPNNGNGGEKYPILLDKDCNEAASLFFFDEGANEGKWSDVHAGEAWPGGAIIVITIQRDTYGTGLSVGSIDTAYAEVGQPYQNVITVNNGGQTPVTSFKYTYSVNEGEPFEGEYTPESPLEVSITDSYQVLLDFDAVDEVGEYVVDLVITEVNGVENQSENGAGYFALEVLPFKINTTPLIEEFTGLGCTWCPRGYVAMEYLHEEYPDDAVLLCYHTDSYGRDPMMTTLSVPMNFTAAPSASINRQSIIDPYYGDYTYGMRDLGIVDDMFAAASKVAIADIQITGVEFNTTDSIINVKTDVRFAKGVANDAYRIGYVLSCNRMWNADWAQTNGYSRQTQYANTPLISECVTWPAKKYNLIYNDVVIKSEAMKGIANSITNVTVGETLTHEYSFDVKTVQNSYRQSLYPSAKVQNMVVNAFIIEKSTGLVVNATKFKVSDVYDSVEVIGADEANGEAVWYDLQGRKVSNPDRGIYVRVQGGKAEKVIL